MNKCPYVLKRFHALKKELQIFLLTIFQVPGMDLPEPREGVEFYQHKNVTAKHNVGFVVASCLLAIASAFDPPPTKTQ